MARYIDADAVEKRIADYYDAQLQSYSVNKGKEKERLLGGINYGRNVVRDAPTEDVVPRSEVEKFIQEIDQIQKDKAEVTYLKEQLIKKAKQEVAKQIFEEIEKLMHKLLNDEHYITGDMCWDITELKKKYIGE